MKFDRRTILIPLFLILALPAFSKTMEKDFDHTWVAREGARLSVENENGSIEIDSWDRNEIRVEAHMKMDARNDDAGRKAFDAFRIDVRETPGGLELSVKSPREKEGFLSWLFGDSLDAEVRYRVKVPRNYDVTATTVNGQVDAANLNGDLRFETVNGRVSVRESAGSVSAESVNGRIDVELVAIDPNSSMRFETVNGGVRLRLPADARLSLDASTTNGSIDTEIPVATRKFSRNRIEGDLNGGGAMIRIETVNGGVDIVRR